MSLEYLQRLITKTAKAVYDNEKFPVGVLAVRARRVAEVFPTDQTVVQMSNFLSKRASKEGFISRLELKDVYNRLYTPNNKFAEHFPDELGMAEQTQDRKMLRDPREGEDLVQTAYEKMADPILANALASAFDSSIPYKAYSEELAKKAQKSCLHGLNSCGLPPKKVDVVAGQPDLLICQASYETPKGAVSVLVPVEIKDKKALLPTIFLSEAGFKDFDKDAIKNHLVSSIQNPLKVNPEKVLQVVATAKNGMPETVSEVEEIVIKAASLKGTPVQHSTNPVIGLMVDDPHPNVKLAEYEVPAEVEEIAKNLVSPSGAAGFLFGKQAVEMGRKHVHASLAQMGYPNAQIAVSDNNKNTIFYAVSIDNRVGFTVPVKVSKGTAQAPEMIVSASGVVDFSKEGISQVLASNDSDMGILAKTSSFAGLKSSELVTQVKEAMLDKNYLKAEDALTVLHSSGDARSYKVAYDIYTAGLANKLAKPEESKCKLQVKNAHSKHLVCGHTNLPVHKVYQDKHGDCQPLYRKNMEESYEGGTFLNSKIFF